MGGLGPRPNSFDLRLNPDKENEPSPGVLGVPPGDVGANVLTVRTRLASWMVKCKLRYSLSGGWNMFSSALLDHHSAPGIEAFSAPVTGPFKHALASRRLSCRSRNWPEMKDESVD